MVVMFYDVTTNTELVNTKPVTAPRIKKRLGSFKLLVTVFID